MDNVQSRSLNVLMSISVSLNKEQSTPLANFAVATTRGWDTRAGSSLSLLTHAIQWVRTENEVCVPLWTCQSFHWIPFLPVQYVQYSMAAKTFWLAPPGVAQLSDLVLEGTSFSIKKQGTTVKRNEPYFVLCPGNCDNEGDGGQWLPVSESKEGKTHLRTIGQIFASRTGCSQRYLWVWRIGKI